VKENKSRNVYMAIAVAVLALAGVILYAKFGPGSKQDKTVTVEVVDAIPTSFNQTALNQLGDPTKTVNYAPTISLDGLGNSRPFGPLR
jgi:hypothetical protein